MVIFKACTSSFHAMSTNVAYWLLGLKRKIIFILNVLKIIVETFYLNCDNLTYFISVSLCFQTNSHL